MFDELSVAENIFMGHMPVTAAGLVDWPQMRRRAGELLKRIDADLRADPEANRLFLDILTSERDPETTLRRMNEAGVLGRFIPEFGRLIGQTQFNMYHAYTVDEHTLMALGLLHAIDQGLVKSEAPLASEIMPRITQYREPPGRISSFRFGNMRVTWSSVSRPALQSLTQDSSSSISETPTQSLRMFRAIR
jgi:hypothetical protein